jgi:hypothetical protein
MKVKKNKEREDGKFKVNKKAAQIVKLYGEGKLKDR